MTKTPLLRPQDSLKNEIRKNCWRRRKIRLRRR